jgi:hypothetical protein
MIVLVHAVKLIQKKAAPKNRGRESHEKNSITATVFVVYPGMSCDTVVKEIPGVRL